MSELAKRLRDQRHEAWEKAKAISERAVEENRNLNLEEQRQWDAHIADIDKLDERGKELVDAEQRAQDANEAFAAIERQPVDPRSGFAERSWLPSRSEYRSWIEERATDSGGAFIPVAYAGTYWDKLRAKSVVLNASPVVLPVEHAGSIQVPQVTASVTVSGVAENATIAPSDPTLANLELDPKKFAALALVSNEALADSHPDLRKVIANDLMKQTATVVDQQMIHGDGTGNNLTGLVNVSGAATADLGGTVSLDGAAGMLATLEENDADRSRGVYFISPTDWATLRTEKASTAGTYQLQPDPSAAEARTLFGVPVATSTNVPSGTLLLADMSQVVVGRSQDVVVQMSTEFAFDSDQTALRVTARFDLGVMNAEALVVGTTSA